MSVETSVSLHQRYRERSKDNGLTSKLTITLSSSRETISRLARFKGGESAWKLLSILKRKEARNGSDRARGYLPIKLNSKGIKIGVFVRLCNVSNRFRLFVRGVKFALKKTLSIRDLDWKDRLDSLARLIDRFRPGVVPFHENRNQRRHACRESRRWKRKVGEKEGGIRSSE